MIRINIAEAKARLSRYIESVEKGETVVVCRRNVPIAEIRPLPQSPRQKRPVGIDRGMAVPASFFEPLPDDVLDAFEGDHTLSGTDIVVDGRHWPVSQQSQDSLRYRRETANSNAILNPLMEY